VFSNVADSFFLFFLGNFGFAVDNLFRFGVVPTVNGCLQQGMEALQFFVTKC
jgi:hypothetical protein